MISFIIIGRNEEKTIRSSIKSVLHAIEHCLINDFEILYVDSKSGDNTLQVVNEYSQIKTFVITGTCNAAIARNIGARNSIGNILCFLDGDMELNADFLKVAIINNRLIHPFISGQLKNYYYCSYSLWNMINTDYLHKNLKNDRYEVTTGGYFIIEKETWFSVNGMKTKFRRSQDLDIGLRLAKKGVKLLRKKELMVNHHTIHYENNDRRWKMLFDGGIFFTSVLIRDHLSNREYYRVLFRKNYSFLLLILSLMLLLKTYWFICVYIFMLFIRILFKMDKITLIEIYRKFSYFLVVDILCLVGLIFYYPKNIKIKYKQL